MPRYCEDYPCCGHTDGLGCNWKPPTDYPHAGCDHNAGYCFIGMMDDDDEADDTPDHLCEVCRYPLEPVNGVWVHTFPDDSHKPVYLMDDAE